MRISLFIRSLLLVIAIPLSGQGIRGEIRDINGEPAPYAAIFIKELTRGTTCNALGQFSLPLPQGSYTIFFRSLGYTEVTRSIEVGPEYTDLDIRLPPQPYMIPEVRISATGEDPAYWIMRKTIGLAHYHLHEVSSYDAEIYIKGTAIINRLPRAIAKRIEVNELKVEENETYMLESLNEVKFKAPEHYEMRVIASQNTLPGYTDNVNPMDYINASLYQQEIEGVVSPLARNAFSYYRFSLEGTFLEGTHMVNKIKVTPKRKSQQLVEGILYIVEDLWCLHSSDLSLHTMAGTLYLQQLYANVMMDAWLPVSHKIRAEIEIVGVEGEATYVSSLEYSNVTLNPNLPKTYFTAAQRREHEPADSITAREPVSRKQEKINELLDKDELTNREVSKLSKLIAKETEKGEEKNENRDLDQTGTTFSIDEDAVKNDSLYWNKVRPIPLTPEEHITLQVRDSIMGTGSPKPAGDSVRTVKRKQKPLKNLIYGKRYYSAQGKFRLKHEGLLDPDRFTYNTVDGIIYGQELRLEWWPDSIHAIRSGLVAGYAFHRKAPLISWKSDLLYAPMARGQTSLYLNWRSSDFNGPAGIPDRTNLLYTVFLRQNHLKLYEQIDATLFNRIDPVNGMVLTTYATYGVQNRLENNSLFSVFYRNAVPERFTPNTPGGVDSAANELRDHHRFIAHMELEFTPKRYYVIRNSRKNYRDSKWPTFRIAYRRAIPLEMGGWSDFSMVEAGIRHTFNVGLLSQLKWSLSTGYFPHATSIHFSDYKHFKTNPLYVDMAGLDEALMFSDYYNTSTNSSWLHLHATLTSSYLLVKFLPWFSEGLWKESLDVAYLHTPATKNYLQFGYSMNELFFLVDFGIYAGFGELDPGATGEWGYRGVTARLNFRF
ncbi:MAG: DUF5686 and carboxypeptidase regulatory-like domain-containing protein [Bacteroidota bacterium]